MDGRSVAWLAYLPIPGLALIPLWLAPADRLARFHARQGGLLISLLYVGLVLLGFLGRDPNRADAAAVAASVVLFGGLIGAGWGLVGAARGRYARVRPVWDLCGALWR